MLTLHNLKDTTRFRMLYMILYRTMKQAQGMFTVGADADMKKDGTKQLAAVNREMHKFEQIIMREFKPEHKQMYKTITEALSVLYYDLLHDLHKDKHDATRLFILEEVDKAADPKMVLTVLKLFNEGVLKSANGKAMNEMKLEDYIKEYEETQGKPLNQ